MGEVLGSAPNAMYLREPITQSVLAADGGSLSVVAIDPHQPPPAYRRSADAAFRGFPAFPPHVVRQTSQWRLRERGRRRLVIKEVNPLGIEWLLATYPLRLVLLVRHPAAVAMSYRKLGWLRIDLEGRFRSLPPGGRLDGWRPLFRSASSFWEEMGLLQGATLRVALDAVQGRTDCRMLVYEDLCSDPVRHFRDLYLFAGLEWTSRIEALVLEKSASGDRADPLGTSRLSRHMIHGWRDEISGEDARQVRRAFAGFELPWYTSAGDW